MTLRCERPVILLTVLGVSGLIGLLISTAQRQLTRRLHAAAGFHVIYGDNGDRLSTLFENLPPQPEAARIPLGNRHGGGCRAERGAVRSGLAGIVARFTDPVPVHAMQ
jgi:hypothetical protein